MTDYLGESLGNPCNNYEEKIMKKIGCFFCAILLLLSAASCGSSQNDNTSSTRETETSEEVVPANNSENDESVQTQPAGNEPLILHAGIVDTTASFSPVSSGNILAKNMVYDTLLRMDDEGNLYPWVADSLEITEDEMIICLKDNVYFNNGEKLTGEDVVYSFYSYTSNPSSSYGSKFACINFDETTISDDGLTVTFKLDYIYQPMKYYIPKVYLLDKSTCENWASDEPGWWDSPVSSGAYEVAENIDGSHCTLQLREDYWNRDALPQWDEVIINYYTNATAMFIAFENDELDIALDLDEKDYARLLSGDTANADHASCAALGNGGTHLLILDSYCEYFDDPKVREAIAHAIDYDSLMSAVYGSLGKTGCGSICGSDNLYYEYQGEYTFDLDYARQCMAESAYPDGFTCNIVSMNSYSTEWEILQAELDEIGIKLEISLYDNPTVIQMYMQEGSTDMTVIDNESNSRHPSECIDMFNDNSFLATHRIFDPYYNELYNASTSTFDENEVSDIFREIQKWFFENMRVIVLGEVSNAIAWNTDVCTSNLYKIRGDYLAWAVTPMV